MMLRGSHLLILLFWLASMSWLVLAKMMPAMIGGDPPDYQSRLAHTEREPECWRVKYNEKTIGFAASQVTRRPDGTSELRNVVHFEQLPLDAMLRQLFGGLSFLVRPVLGDTGSLQVEMLVATQLHFDSVSRPERFRSIIDLNDQQGLLTVDGTLDAEGKFEFVARLSDELGGQNLQRDVFRHSLRLSPEALISDSVSPRAELKQLHVGQTWTVPVYRAFPPNQPVQVVQAKVERHEIIFWEGGDVETLLVVYRDDSGAPIQSAREPLGKEWVRADGVILRQEVTFAGMRVQFERYIDSWGERRTDWLDRGKHPRLWSTAVDD